jgi:predicted transcriptional regulator
MKKPEPEPLINTSVRLTQASIDALEKIGKQEDRAVSYLIRKAVEEFVAKRAQ